MRILLTGNSKPWKVGAGIARALRRAGHDVWLLDDRKIKRRIGFRATQLWARARRRLFRPDYVILDKCHALSLETVAALIRDTPNAMWYHDPVWVRHPGRRDIAHIIQVARLARNFFVTGFDDEWRAFGLPAKFLPAAGDRDIVPVPPDPAYGSPVSFIGTGYASDRAEFLKRVAARYPLRVWGAGWERWRDVLNWSGRKAEFDVFAKVCSSSGIMLGVDPEVAQNATNWVSNRQWLTILAGGFYLGKGSPGVKQLVRDGEHCAFYDDMDSLLERIGYYLARPDERDAVRRAGEAFVRAHHTFDRRIENLLSGRAFENPHAASRA